MWGGGVWRIVVEKIFVFLDLSAASARQIFLEKLPPRISIFLGVFSFAVAKRGKTQCRIATQSMRVLLKPAFPWRNYPLLFPFLYQNTYNT